MKSLSFTTFQRRCATAFRNREAFLSAPALEQRGRVLWRSLVAQGLWEAAWDGWWTMDLYSNLVLYIVTGYLS